MRLNPLNETIILIDTDYLNLSIDQNLSFYRDLYPEKDFNLIDLDTLLYSFVTNARIYEPGRIIDVLFAFTLSNSTLHHCMPNDVFDYVNNSYQILTDLGIIIVRSFFAEEEVPCGIQTTNMLSSIYRSPNVSRIIIVADNEYINEEIENIYNDNLKSLFMFKDPHESSIQVPIKYVNIVYPIAGCLGLNSSEI